MVRRSHRSSPVRRDLRAARLRPKEDAGQRRGGDQLEKLAQLHERGVLTDSEFQAQKTKLLAS
ncbi:MAG: SHOCT domain-containing protein [Caulobacterales bacterium]|nr:SHOCT domain-containing protein [Caulobacterales bacterium]